MNKYFNPMVSIVIPVYNGSNYLREAIDSALAQTYGNIEVIVVNDGSIDDGATEKIALSYGDKIKYFHKTNGGVATALNFGIEKMSGDYFSWLSHDDVYYDDKIQTQINYLKRIDNKDIILYGGYDLINESSKLTGSVKPDAIYSEDKLNIQLFPVLRGLINGCTLLINKKYFDQVGKFDKKLKTTQDYALWFEIFRQAEIKFHHENLVKTRIHDERGTFKIPNHVAECNALWIGFLNSVTDHEMIAIDDSQFLFYQRTALFLKDTQYAEAKEHALYLADNVIKNTMISVIIPFYNRINLTLKAVASVMQQTHVNFEILLIDDGSDEDITQLIDLTKNNEKIRYYRQDNKGVSTARNTGLSLARGSYVAFLDSDDLFLPDKLEKQLILMEQNASFFSHTSYERISLTGEAIECINSGSFSGDVFPRIIASCGIATPTVMAKKEVFVNFKFKEDITIGEDVCLWIDIASKYSILGCEECLTKVRIGENTAALNIEKQKDGLFNIISYLMKNKQYLDCDGSYYLHLLIIDWSKLFLMSEKKSCDAEIVSVKTDNMLTSYNDDVFDNKISFGSVVLNPLKYSAKLFNSIKQDGFFETVKKIVIKFRSHR